MCDRAHARYSGGCKKRAVEAAFSFSSLLLAFARSFRLSFFRPPVCAFAMISNGGLVQQRTNVELMRSVLTNKRQVADGLAGVAREQGKRVRIHGPEHGSGADLLNRATHEMSASAPNLIGGSSRDRNIFHMARGADPPTPFGIERVLAAAATPGARAPNVLSRHLGKARPGDDVLVRVWVDMRKLSDAVRKNPGLLEHFFSKGVPVWTSMRGGDNVNEVMPVNELNRVKMECVRLARTQADVPQTHYADFRAVWGHLGVCAWVVPVLDTSSMHGRADACMTAVIDGVNAIPNFWVDWPVPLAVDCDLHLVYVERTLGLEEDERACMLRGSRDAWLERYEEHIKNLKQAGQVRASAAQRVSDADARRRANNAGGVGVHPSAPVDASTAVVRLPALFAEPIRYARWEPYVTFDGRPPPATFYMTTSPEGVPHRGGYVTIMRVTAWSDQFTQHKRWTALARQLLYSPIGFDMERDMKQVSGSIKTLPRVQGLVHTNV
jgi:hypothetical protein